MFTAIHKTCRWIGSAVAACLCAGVLIQSPAARAVAIVSDNFDAGAHKTSINGTAPEGANLPGGTWSVTSDSFNYYSWTDTPDFGGPATSLFFWIPGNVTVGFGGAATVPISSGTYTPPAKFSITTDFLFTNISSGQPNAGAMLGFYSTPSDPTHYPTLSDATIGFTGLIVNSSGQLSLVENGTIASTADYTGTFNPNVFDTLSYDVDTSTGNISNVDLAGNTNYSFSSSAFTVTNTAYAAIGLRYTNSDTYGYADNFSVDTIPDAVVPEPASLSLLALGGVLTLCRRRRA